MTIGSEVGTWTVVATPLFVVAAVAVALTLAAWQIVRLARRPPIRRRRIAALVIALACLVLLAIGPARIAPASGASAVLWTDAVEDGGPGDGVGERFVVARAVREADGAVPDGAVVVPDAAWLARRGGLSRLRLVGHGLEEWAWLAMGDVEIEAAPPRLDPGVVSLGWPRRVTVGVRWQVDGRLVGLGPGSLRLFDPGGEVDRVAIEAGDPDGAFSFGAVPRAPGRWSYRLLFEPDAGEEVELGAIDVWARGATLPRVFWLESAPGFETRHLKDWLTDAGGGLAVRSVISEDRFRFERHNLPDIDLQRIDAETLDRFDVVVAEERFLASLGRRAENALRTAVEGGLGLLVLPDSPKEAPASGSNEPWFLLPIEKVPGIEADDEGQMAVRIAWADGTLSTPLSMAPRQVRDDGDVAPLLADPQGRVLAAHRSLVGGQVGISLIEDSFRWVLEGHPGHHRRAWSLLLDAIARPRPVPRIVLPSGPLLVDRPLPLVVDLPAGDAGPGPPEARLLPPSGRVRTLAWRQDVLLPARWHAVYWPAATGWAGLRLDDGTEAWWQVQPAAAWPTWRQAQRQRATVLHLARQRPAASPDAEAVDPRLRPIGRLGLFLLALGCLAFLWVDERMAGRFAP